MYRVCNLGSVDQISIVDKGKTHCGSGHNEEEREETEAKQKGASGQGIEHFS